MAQMLTSPFTAFAIYLMGGAILLGIGRMLAGAGHPSAEKSGIYASGEAAPRHEAVPGYRTFFVAALFFAVLHLGALIVAAHPPSAATAIYVGGLLITLLAMLTSQEH